MTRSMRADAGIMISASHNSYEDNGIKFFGADGFKLADDTEDEIERLMQPGHLDVLRASPDVIGKMFRIDDAVGRYTVYLKSCIPRDFKLDGFKVVLDCANGAAYRVAPLVFGELGAELTVIGNRPDGKNINANCGSTYPEAMAAEVRRIGADCGIAFDGDGDRVIMCDERGELMDGDLILAICGIALKKAGQLQGNSLVGTVMSNLGLEKSLEREGIALRRSGVGDRYVLNEMVANGLNLGGEQSGHVIFLDHSTTGDGLLTALMLLSLIKRDGKPLSEYRKLIERYPQELINIKVRERIPFDQIPSIQSMLVDVERRLGSTGRVLLRYSGTEKKARVMVEAENEQLCKTAATDLAEVLQKELGEK